ADGLAGLDPVLALGALAVDSDLAGSQELLEGAMTEVGEMPLEPAVQTQTGLVVDDGAHLHARARRDVHGLIPCLRFTQIPSLITVGRTPLLAEYQGIKRSIRGNVEACSR